MDESPAVRLVMALAALASALAGLAVIWMELPAAQRQLMVLSARTCLRGHAGRLARAAGRRAMGRELAGTPERRAGYDLACRLASLRDRL